MKHARTNRHSPLDIIPPLPILLPTLPVHRRRDSLKLKAPEGKFQERHWNSQQQRASRVFSPSTQAFNQRASAVEIYREKY